MIDFIDFIEFDGLDRVLRTKQLLSQSTKSTMHNIPCALRYAFFPAFRIPTSDFQLLPTFSLSEFRITNSHFRIPTSSFFRYALCPMTFLSHLHTFSTSLLQFFPPSVISAFRIPTSDFQLLPTFYFFFSALSASTSFFTNPNDSLAF